MGKSPREERRERRTKETYAFVKQHSLELYEQAVAMATMIHIKTEDIRLAAEVEASAMSLVRRAIELGGAEL